VSNEEKIISMLEALATEVSLIKTEQAKLNRLLNEHTEALKKIKEAVLAQSERSNSLNEKLEYFERKYQGMGA